MRQKQAQKLFFNHLSKRVPTFFLRVRWRLHLRKSRFFFSEIFRLVVLIQGHFQVRVPAFQHVSRVTTGIRLIHCPGLFHIYVVTGHSLSAATTEIRTIFKICVIISGLHVAIAASSWVHFIQFLHTIVHFVTLAQFLLYIYIHYMHAFISSICPTELGIYAEKRTSIHMQQNRKMNKHHQHTNPACFTLRQNLMCSNPIQGEVSFELSCRSKLLGSRGLKP